MKSIICNNCFQKGHQMQHCKLPIQSYGIICYRYDNETNDIKYLMIRRKDSFSYIDLIRGKYIPNNIQQLQFIVDNITIDEKKKIIQNNYEQLRNDLWHTQITPNNYKAEDINAQKKFDTIQKGIKLSQEKNTLITIKNIIQNSNTNFLEQEWEFPKGRRNNYEKDLPCALREFEEETGYSKHYINIIYNVQPYEEIFIGSNYKSYKHTYYVANFPNYTDDIFHYHQMTEVSKVEWKTLDECLQSIRPSSVEKKNILLKLNKLLLNHNIV